MENTASRAIFHKEFVWALAGMLRSGYSRGGERGVARDLVYATAGVRNRGWDGQFVVVHGSLWEKYQAAGYTVKTNGVFNVTP